MVQCSTDEASAGKYVDQACRAHLTILDYELVQNEKTSVKLFFSVLAATDVSQVGKEMSDYFPCSGGAVAKFLNVAEAVGLITAAQKKNSLDQKTPRDIDETQFKGRQLCADISIEPKRVRDATGKWIDDPQSTKAYPHVNFDTYSVFDDRAKDVPKDVQFIAMLQGNAAAAQAAPAQQQQAAPAEDLSMNF